MMPRIALLRSAAKIEAELPYKRLLTAEQNMACSSIRRRRASLGNVRAAEEMFSAFTWTGPGKGTLTPLLDSVTWINAAASRSRYISNDRRFSEDSVNPTQEETSLFERIGGSEALLRMVSAFYTRVLDDRNLRPYFQGVELDKLYNMQFEFFSVALGGPSSYTGRTLQQAHRGRKISRDHFHAFVQHLLDTLKEYPLTAEERHAIIARINTFADDVIGDGTKVN